MKHSIKPPCSSRFLKYTLSLFILLCGSLSHEVKPLGFASTKGFDLLLNKGFNYINPLFGMAILNRQDLLFNLMVLGNDGIQNTVSHPLVLLAQFLFNRPPTNNIHALFKASGWVKKTFTCEQLGWLCALIVQSEPIDEKELDNVLATFEKRGKKFGELFGKYKTTKKSEKIKNQLKQNQLSTLEQNWFDFIANVRTQSKFSYGEFTSLITLLIHACEWALKNNILVYDHNIPLYMLAAIASEKAQKKNDLLLFIEGFAKHYDKNMATVLSPEGLAVINNKAGERELFLNTFYSKADSDALYNQIFTNPTESDLLFGILNMREYPRTLNFEGHGDCTEAGILHLADTYLFNPELGTYDLSLVPSSIQNRKEVADFTKKFTKGLNDQEARKWWYYLFSDINHKAAPANFMYAQENTFCELQAQPENIYKALAFFFGVTANDFKELGEKLSSDTIKVSFEVIKIDRKDRIYMSIEINNKQNARTAELIITHHVHTEVVNTKKSDNTTSFLKFYNKSDSDMPFTLFIERSQLWKKGDTRALIMQSLDRSYGFSSLCSLYGDDTASDMQQALSALINLEKIKPLDINLSNLSALVLAKNANKPPFKNYVQQLPIESLINAVFYYVPELITTMGYEWTKKNALEIIIGSRGQLSGTPGINYFNELHNALNAIKLPYKKFQEIVLEQLFNRITTATPINVLYTCFDTLINVNEEIWAKTFKDIDAQQLTHPLVALLTKLQEKALSPQIVKQFFDLTFSDSSDGSSLLHPVGDLYLLDLLAHLKNENVDVSMVLPSILEKTFFNITHGKMRLDQKNALDEFITLFPEMVTVKARQNIIKQSPAMLATMVQLEKKVTKVDENILIFALNELVTEKDDKKSLEWAEAFKSITPETLIKDFIINQKTFLDLLGEKQNMLEKLTFPTQASLAKTIMLALTKIYSPESFQGYQLKVNNPPPEVVALSTP